MFKSEESKDSSTLKSDLGPRLDLTTRLENPVTIEWILYSLRVRTRETSRWGIGKLYPSPDYFTTDEVEDGLHTIQLGNQLMDILVRDRRSSVTVVTFQHRVSLRTTYPTLVGEGFTGKKCESNRCC